MKIRFILILAFNFLALAIGAHFTTSGVISPWYDSLLKAPWTPPGWVFGAAWTIIMICLTFYMVYAWEQTTQRWSLLILYFVQWILNVVWNPIFFALHHILLGLRVIIALTLLMMYIAIKFYPTLKIKTTWLLPYIVWLLVATSLNFYIYVQN